jgi:hypothetical protein
MKGPPEITGISPRLFFIFICLLNFAKNTDVTEQQIDQWRNYYGLGPGASNPNGGPQAQAITYRATIHQNSVKSLPKVQEMAFQRV